MKKIVHQISILTLLCLVSCQSNKESYPPLPTGIWRAVIQSPGGELPFGMEIEKQTDTTYTVYIINGSERLRMDEASLNTDSLHIPMHLFASKLVAHVGDSVLTGYYLRQAATRTIRMPFSAQAGRTNRFAVSGTAPSQQLSGKWDVTFYTDTDSSKAVGVLEQHGTQLTGTFLTPTGDYRYLDGTMAGNTLQLSSFDGSHVYLFKAQAETDQKISGEFWSGDKGYRKWIAIRNANATLPDANTYTQLKKGYTTLSFSFPTYSGKQVSLGDEKYKGKVVIVQILGSWCPNCMDETAFLAPWYKKNKERGVEIIGLAFENTTDMQVSGPKLERMRKRFDIDYEIALAGVNDTTASQALPMLEKIKGYPTTLFIDKKGNVRRIHTGFSGPGTGKYYDAFVEEFNLFVDKLLAEK